MSKHIILTLLATIVIVISLESTVIAGNVAGYDDKRINTSTNFELSGYPEYADDWVLTNQWNFPAHNNEYPEQGGNKTNPINPKSETFKEVLFNGKKGESPKAAFKIQVLRPDGSVRSESWCEAGFSLDKPSPRISAYTGDSIRFIDNSRIGSGQRIVQWDFQYAYLFVKTDGPDQNGKVFYGYSADLPDWPGGTNYRGGNVVAGNEGQVEEFARTIELDRAGYLQLYLSVQDDADCGPNGSNWSTNGNYTTLADPNSGQSPYPWYTFWYYTSLVVEVEDLATYKDVTVVAAGEGLQDWDPVSHCLNGKVATGTGLRELPDWIKTGAAGESGNDGAREIYGPGDTVNFSYTIWNPGKEAISGLPWDVGWISYSSNWLDQPGFTPIPGQDAFSITSLQPGQNIGERLCAITLPNSFQNLPVVSGRTIKERADLPWVSQDLSSLDDNTQFLALAVIADSEHALQAWPKLFSAPGAGGPLGEQEIRLQNNMMIVLIPVMSSDLMVTGNGSSTYQREYPVVRETVINPLTLYAEPVNRFDVVYAFYNLSAEDQAAVPYRIVACRAGSESEGVVLAEGVVDIPASGKTPDTTLKVDYDALGLGEEYQASPCVAVILDPDNLKPESNEDNNVALFKPGGSEPVLSIEAYSPPAGFPVHSTGWASITVTRKDNLATDFDATVIWEISGAKQSKTIHVSAGSGTKDQFNITQYSDVAVRIPVNASVIWVTNNGEQEAVGWTSIIFGGDIVTSLPPPPEYEDDVIVGINGG